MNFLITVSMMFVGIFLAFVVVIIARVIVEARKPSTMVIPPKVNEPANKPTVAKVAGKEIALPDDIPITSYELYDHPGPPIPLLAASLPSAPLGYGWEINTVTNEDANPALRLALLNLRTSLVEDVMERDLVVVRRWKYAPADTYATFYRRAAEVSAKEVVSYDVYGTSSYRDRMPVYRTDHSKMLGKVMIANLITPMVDWARLLVLRYIVEHPDETKVNYVLLESTEGRAA